jgi:hypothetical protein
MNVGFHALAREELDQAILYYEGRLVGLGIDLLEEVQRVSTRLQQNPELGGLYGSSEVRFARCRRFPYVVYYLVQPQLLWIVAVAHQSRRPGYWLPRNSR